MVTRLEKIADSFVESHLKDHPIMFYSLDTELEEYVLGTNELRNTDVINEILQEYQRNDKKKALDDQITQELMNESQRALDRTKGLENCKTAEEKRQYLYNTQIIFAGN